MLSPRAPVENKYTTQKVESKIIKRMAGVAVLSF